MTLNRGPMSLVGGVLAGLLLFSLSPRLQAQNDPLLGTWKLNVAKSKYQGTPLPMSETRVYEPFGGAGAGVKATFNRVDAAGKKITVTYSAMYDGKDYKYSGPDAETIALRRTDANSIDATLKKGGKVVQTARGVVSADGKMRTLTATGTDDKGQKFTAVSVWDRQ